MRHDQFRSNLELVESSKGFLSPQIFNIREDRWITSVTRHASNPVVNSRIRYFVSKGYDHVIWHKDVVFMGTAKAMKNYPSGFRTEIYKGDFPR